MQGEQRHAVGAISQGVVVITGASSGIGRATARQFASQGAAVVLAARGEPSLHATAEVAADNPRRGFHPTLARSAAIVSAGTLGWRLARDRPARLR